MNINEIEIENFMPYKEKQSVVLPQDFNQNVMIIYGDNMRGKTSFLNAIRWCLYGKALGRQSKIIPLIDLINSEIPKDEDFKVSVRIAFQSNSIEYELIRTIQKKKNVYQASKDSDLEENVLMKKNQYPITSNLIKHEINQIIPENISRFFLFDGELLQEYEMLLSEESNQGEEIKDSIEKILGVPALLNSRNDFTELIDKAREIQMSEAKSDSELQRFTIEHDELEDKKKSIQDDLLKLRESLIKIKSDIDELDEKLNNQYKANNLIDKKEDLENKINKLMSENSYLHQDQLSCLKDSWKFLITPSLNDVIQKLKYELRGLENDSNNNIIFRNEVASFEESLNSLKCITCEQKLDQQSLDRIDSKLKEYKLKIESFNNINQSKKNRLQARVENFEETLPAEENKLFKIIEISQNNTSKLTKYEYQLELLKNQLKDIDVELFTSIKVNRDKYVKQQARIEDKIKSQEVNLHENEQKREKLSYKITKSKSQKNNKGSRLLEIYKQLKDIFEIGIDKLRSDLKITVANNASSTFKALTNESTYQGLDINDNYGLTIKDKNGQTVTQRSAGAEQIVALSLIDGLNKTSNLEGPIIMDTPLGRLDLKHREKVLQFIPKMAKQVVLLVHEGEIKKNVIQESLLNNIGKQYEIERISSSESKLLPFGGT